MNGFGNPSGGSLFGQQNTSQSGGGLFGNQASSNTFGSSAPKRTQSIGGMFGTSNTGSSATNQGGLFGSPSNGNTGSGLFGSTANNNSANTGSTSLFGSKPPAGAPAGSNNPPSTGLFGSANQQNGNTGASNGLFGNATQQNSTTAHSGGLFGANQQNANTNKTGSLFGSVSQGNTSGGGLFDQSNQQNSAGSPFGKPQPSNTGLFGSRNGTNPGGLFGSQNQNQSQGQTAAQQQPQQQGLFGNSSSQSGGGLFGKSSATSQNSGAVTGAGGSLFGNSSSSGGLFANASKPSGAHNGGGLFGSGNTATSNSSGSKPLFTGAVGSLSNATQQAQPSQQQALHATIDHASYVLPGVSPSQKLYTSLTQPAQKRTAHEARRHNGYSVEENFSASSRDYAKPTHLPLEPSRSSSSTLTGPSGSRGALAAVSTTNAAHGEPRQWINSYEKFLKERPTSLVIKREGRRQEALPSPPVSTAPPVIASVAKESSSEELAAARDSTIAADKSHAPIEPDVSLFHRQANNMTVVQVSKKALEEGYYIFPRLEALSAMSKSQLAAVPNLVVGRDNFGQIEYPGTVDLSRIANLGDILGSLVIFEAGTVCVYPEEEFKALPGHELNMPCTVTIENAWPVDAVTRKKIKDMEDPRMQKHINRLREKCESDGGEFVTFAHGIWVFKVPHFSTWGLPVEDMLVDAEEKVSSPTSVDGSLIMPEAENRSDQGVMLDVVESSDIDLDNEIGQDGTEVIENWQDQLSHAALSSYTASNESLFAASNLQDTQDLGAVLMPKASNSDKWKAPDAAHSSSHHDSKDAAQEMRAAIQGPLRLDALKRHMTTSQRDNSTLPLLHTQLDVGTLQQLRPERTGLWRLLATLYSEGGIDELKLSQWLDAKVSAFPQRDAGNSLDNIWALLTTHRLKEAIDLSLKTNNPHLAVLLSLFENSSGTPSDADEQLRSWKESRSLASIPVVVKHVWELASGAAPAPSGLNWAQWLGMRLWYSSTLVSEAISKVPTSLLSDSGPELSLIRQAVGAKQLKTVIEELPLVDAFLLLQALDTVSPLAVKQDMKCYDGICFSLAKIAEEVGETSTAIYAALHVKDAKTRFDVVHGILVDMPDNVSLHAIQSLGIPEQLLDEARAAHARKTHNYQSGAEYLLRAGLYEQAHQVVIEHVAPQAVLEGRAHDLKDLLLSLEAKKDHLRRWSLGAEVYLQYLRALEAGDSLERYDLKALCNSCRYAHTPNLRSQAAISVVAKWVSSNPKASLEFGPDVALNMKLDPSQMRLVALQQACRLLV